MGQAEEASQADAIAVVVRLAWQSRQDGALISPTFLRDHFLRNFIPPSGTPYCLSLLECSTVHVEMISTSPVTTAACPVVGAEHTSFFLLPPLPPRLSVGSLPVSLPVLSDGSLQHLFTMSVGSNPDTSVAYCTGIGVPKTLLLPSGFDTDVAQAVAVCSVTAGANLLYVPATAVLRNVATQDGLLASLRAHVAAARAASPAVLLLLDTQFLFPPDDHEAAAAFLLACAELSESERVVIIASCSPSVDTVHETIRNAVDFILPSLEDPENSEQRSPLRCTEGLQEGVKLISRRNVNTLDDGESPDARCQRLTQQWQEVSTELGGLEEPQRILKTVLLWRQTRSDTFKELGVKPCTGVLLYGCPGTGKTALVRLTALAADFVVLGVDAALIARGEVGASERLLSETFKRAKTVQPCILFMDEVDALFSSGDGDSPHLTRLVSALALLMDSVEEDIVVIGATNRPWAISKTLLRPGRFEHCIHVPLPNWKARRDIAGVYATRMMLEDKERQCLEELVSSPNANGFSGADIAGACRRAAMSAITRESSIEECDLQEAFRTATPSVEERNANSLEHWRPPS